MLRTFEPFRQDDRNYALISPNYTATSVMNLQTGEIIAGEEPHAAGFCPVGFYVPDWWDVHQADAGYGRLPGRAAGPTITSGLPATSASSGDASGATTHPGKSNTSTSPASRKASSDETNASATSLWTPAGQETAPGLRPTSSSRSGQATENATSPSAPNKPSTSTPASESIPMHDQATGH